LSICHQSLKEQFCPILNVKNQKKMATKDSRPPIVRLESQHQSLSQ
jgi:hypothetical protein